MNLPITATLQNPPQTNTNTPSTTQSISNRICEKIIEKAGQLLQDVNPPKIPFDLEPSMADRVRDLTEDGMLRVAETLCAIAGKLGWTEKIFFEKLPQGILSMPSPHDRRIKDEALICNAENLIKSLNAFTTCFNNLKEGVESELERLAKKDAIPSFTDPLKKYQEFYQSTIPELKRITDECPRLRTKLKMRVKMDPKEKERYHPEHSIDAFSLCYGLKSVEAITKIMDMHERSNKIGDLNTKLVNASKSMEEAIVAFRGKYNFLAHLLIEEIDYDPSDSQILENFNKRSPSYLDKNS